MAVDYDGNTLSNGDKVWIPATVTNAGTMPTITVQPTYGGGTVSILATATRKPRSFPDAP